MTTKFFIFFRGVFVALVSVALFLPTQAAESWTHSVEVWEPPFNMESPRRTVDYTPVAKASKPWNICVSFPHMKDAYWIGANYGIVEESRRAGVRMQLVEAGGYTNLPKQISQIEDCVSSGADAVIIGAISGEGLRNLVESIRDKGIPVIDLINGLDSPKKSAKSGVSFGEMGGKAGEFLAQKHPAGSKKVKVAWFPGPPGAGWVEAGNTGFTSAVADSAVEVVDTKYGDTGKEVQSNLVEDTLEAYPDLDYIVGTAVTAEAAISILRARGLADQVKVISYYYSPGVDRGIRRKQILAAPTDSTVIQARVAVDQAIRILDKQPYEKHVGPALYMVTQDDVESFDSSTTLAPSSFKPIFQVE